MKIMLLFCLLSIFAHTISSEVINPEIVIRNVDRQIDVSSQLAKIICKLTVENAGKSPVKSVLYAVEPQFKQLVSFIGAQV